MKSIILAIICMTLSSCESPLLKLIKSLDNDNDSSTITSSNRTPVIKKKYGNTRSAVPNSLDGSIIKIFIKHRSSLNIFKNKKDVDMKLLDNGDVIVNNTSKKSGTHSCLSYFEYEEINCDHRVIIIDHEDGPYSTKSEIEIIKIDGEEYDIEYMEHKATEPNKYRNKTSFSKAWMYQINVRSLDYTSTKKWLRVIDVIYPKEKLSQDVFYKTLKSNAEEIILTTRIPMLSKKDKVVRTDGTNRDDFRSAYDDHRGTHESMNDTVFSGWYYRSQLNPIGRKKMFVNLKVIGLVE
jgi:hypothetical protein